jgi:hypothetical protein
MAPTWGHVLVVECMRTAASLGTPMPTKTQKNKSKHLGWLLAAGRSGKESVHKEE